MYGFPEIGSVVKFIGVDAHWRFCRVKAYQMDEKTLGFCCVLEIVSGTKKGEIGMVEVDKVKWSGKQWIADMRPSRLTLLQ